MQLTRDRVGWGPAPLASVPELLSLVLVSLPGFSHCPSNPFQSQEIVPTGGQSVACGAPGSVLISPTGARSLGRGEGAM